MYMYMYHPFCNSLLVGEFCRPLPDHISERTPTGLCTINLSLNATCNQHQHLHVHVQCIGIQGTSQSEHFSAS